LRAERVDTPWRQPLLLSSRAIVKLLPTKGARFLCSINSLTQRRNDTMVVAMNVKDNFKRDECKCKRRKYIEELEWRNRDDWRTQRGVDKPLLLLL
jgi:hypothetical protein